jgi:hypothetical protein
VLAADIDGGARRALVAIGSSGSTTGQIRDGPQSEDRESDSRRTTYLALALGRRGDRMNSPCRLLALFGPSSMSELSP